MTTTLYNENAPFAADWLEDLQAHGHIAPGIIDRRSIAELAPGDVAGPGQRHFFAGIGGWSHALRLAGVSDAADIWTGSCPCQGLSDAGARRGFLDPRHLWPAWCALIRECRPPIVFGEQVASTLGLEWLDLVFADLERCGYAVGAADLCAAGVGSPHRRQRLYFVAYTPGDRRLEGLHTQLPERRSEPALSEAHRGGEDGAGGVGDAGRRRVGKHDRELRCNEEEHGQRTPAGDHPPVDSGATRSMADTLGERSSGRRKRGTPQRSALEPAGHRIPGGLADTGRGGRQGRRRGDVRPRRQGSEEHGSDELADTSGPGLEVISQQQARRERETAERGGGAGRVADPADSRRQAAQDPHAGAGDARFRAWRVQPERVGATRGFWAGAEWVLCRDPSGRPPVARPVEPGTFPLAHGVPDRVGLLSGYGNAIVPQVAAVFIRASLDAIKTL